MELVDILPPPIVTYADPSKWILLKLMGIYILEVAAPFFITSFTSIAAANEFDDVNHFAAFMLIGALWTYLGLFVWAVPIVFMAGNIAFGWIFSSDGLITVWLIEHYVSNFGLLFHIFAIGYGLLDIIDALPEGSDFGDFEGATVTYTFLYTCTAIFFEWM